MNSTLTSPSVPRPPDADRLGSGLAVAVVVHAGLVAALAAGVNWHRSSVNVSSAELWAAVPQVAGAAPAPAPPPPPPPPTPAPPAPPAPAKPAPPPAPPKVDTQREAQIALEQKKLKEQKQREAEKLEQEKAAKEKAAKDKAAKEKAEKDKAEKEKERLAKEKAEKAEKAEAERLQKLREANLARLRKELTTSPPAASGQALPQPGRGSASTAGAGSDAQNAAPSASYAGRVRGRVLPNIIYHGPRSGIPPAEVEVRVAPDGRIVSSKLTKSSGSPEWDREVLRALDRTEVLPRDVDGRVPPVMVLSFDPSDR
jgi:colicin import membrane protein